MGSGRARYGNRRGRFRRRYRRRRHDRTGNALWGTGAFLAKSVLLTLIIFVLIGLASVAVLYGGALSNGESVNTDESGLETDIHNLVNGYRVGRGLQPLEWDEELSAVARGHSADMALRDYFSHVTPENTDPAGRAADRGYACVKTDGGMTYSGIAENIFMLERGGGSIFMFAGLTQEGYARTVVDGWLDSPGHLANIVDARVDRQGIGVSVDAGGIYVTQNLC